MKRLYKIIILFLIIFFLGIFISIKSINKSFSNNNIETVSINPSLLNKTVKIIF